MIRTNGIRIVAITTFTFFSVVGVCDFVFAQDGLYGTYGFHFGAMRAIGIGRGPGIHSYSCCQGGCWAPPPAHYSGAIYPPAPTLGYSGYVQGAPTGNWTGSPGYLFAPVQGGRPIVGTPAGVPTLPAAVPTLPSPFAPPAAPAASKSPKHADAANSRSVESKSVETPEKSGDSRQKQGASSSPSDVQEEGSSAIQEDNSTEEVDESGETEAADLDSNYELDSEDESEPESMSDESEPDSSGDPNALPENTLPAPLNSTSAPKL